MDYENWCEIHDSFEHAKAIRKKSCFDDNNKINQKDLAKMIIEFRSCFSCITFFVKAFFIWFDYCCFHSRFALYFVL